MGREVGQGAQRCLLLLNCRHGVLNCASFCTSNPLLSPQTGPRQPVRTHNAWGERARMRARPAACRDGADGALLRSCQSAHSPFCLAPLPRNVMTTTPHRLTRPAGLSCPVLGHIVNYVRARLPSAHAHSRHRERRLASVRSLREPTRLLLDPPLTPQRRSEYRPRLRPDWRWHTHEC